MSRVIANKMVTGFFVSIFAVMWFFSTKYYERPKQYSLVVYDVFGKENTIDGIRTSFSTREVASSFAKEYQKTFPQYSFSLATYIPKVKRKTVFDLIFKKY